MKIANDITIVPGTICKEYTLLCESEKDYQLMFVETISDDNIIDSGWFVQLNKKREIIRVEPKLASSIINKYEYDTLKFHNNLAGKVEGEIVGTIYLFGPNEINKDEILMAIKAD